MPPDQSRAIRRLEATVTGRVQGVGYRYYVLREATLLELDGWVRNEPDESVRCVAEGDARALEVLLARLRTGPPGARVDRVSVAWREPAGESGGFRVVSGAHRGD